MNRLNKSNIWINFFQMRWRWIERKFPKNTVRFNIKLLQISLPYGKHNGHFVILQNNID